MRGVARGGGAGRGLEGLCQEEYRERLQLYLYLRGHRESLLHSKAIGWNCVSQLLAYKSLLTLSKPMDFILYYYFNMSSAVLRSPGSETPFFSREFLWAWELVLILNKLDEC